MPLTDRPERGPGWHMPTSQPTHRDLTRQTLGGLVWIGGGKVVYAGLRLLVLAIMARLLSPADFGIVGAALILVVTRPPALRLLPDRAALGELMYYGGGFTASKIANYFALQVDNLVVGRWLGAAALGFYGRAYELMAGPPHLLGDAVDRVLFPAMASIQTDTRRLADAYRRGVALMGLIMLPASLVLFIVAPELILAMLGPRWTAVVTPFQILALGMFLRTSYRISDVTARATAAVYHRAWRQLVYA